MRSEDKKLIREIEKHKNLEQNLPLFGTVYVNAAYEYALLQLTFDYYTLKEMMEDPDGIRADAYLCWKSEEIHELLFRTLLMGESGEDYEASIGKIQALREELTGQMRVLTAYTDVLQRFEYILNRVEYGATGQCVAVDAQALSERVFRYLFSQDDKMVVNSKIQMVTGQLPIRMTRDKFFEYLSETFMIYQGADTTSVDAFADAMRMTAVFTPPSGYGENYPGIYDMVERLEHTDFHNLDAAAFTSLQEAFQDTSERLAGAVSDQLQVMDVVNALYAAMLAMPYETGDREEIAVCLSMLKELHDAFITEREIPDTVDAGLEKIVGRQEELGEDLLRFESVLEDARNAHEDLLSGMMADKLFYRLGIISKLQSNSRFANLSDDRTESIPADAVYVAAKRDALQQELNAYFDTHAKEENRALMAALISDMPVLFNSAKEIREYVTYSLTHCGNQSELMGCARILEDMMSEDA